MRITLPPPKDLSRGMMTLELYSQPWDGLGRIAVASLLGAVIGLERRTHAQPAGMRTQMLLAASSCLAMEVWRHTGKPPSGHFAQAILTGIGFLGGGTIVKLGWTVQGITTAATIWASAAIGMAVGIGQIPLAAALAAVAVGGLLILSPIETLVTGRRKLRKIEVESAHERDLLRQVRDSLEKHKVRINETGLNQDFERRKLTLNVFASCPERMPVEELALDLGRIPGVSHVRIE